LLFPRFWIHGQQLMRNLHLQSSICWLPFLFSAGFLLCDANGRNINTTKLWKTICPSRFLVPDKEGFL